MSNFDAFFNLRRFFFGISHIFASKTTATFCFYSGTLEKIFIFWWILGNFFYFFLSRFLLVFNPQNVAYLSIVFNKFVLVRSTIVAISSHKNDPGIQKDQNCFKFLIEKVPCYTEKFPKFHLWVFKRSFVCY